jgi:hypothetical protein
MDVALLFNDCIPFTRHSIFLSSGDGKRYGKQNMANVLYATNNSVVH